MLIKGELEMCPERPLEGKLNQAKFVREYEVKGTTEFVLPKGTPVYIGIGVQVGKDIVSYAQSGGFEYYPKIHLITKSEELVNVVSINHITRTILFRPTQVQEFLKNEDISPEYEGKKIVDLHIFPK